MTPEFWFIALDVTEADAEDTGASLFELGATGVEQRDQGTLVRGDAGGVTLVASFASREDADRALQEIDPSLSPRLERIVGDAWRDEYKKYFHPFRLTEGVVVRPPWEEYVPKSGERVLVLEPGRAFGTGLHETTSLVADALAGSAARVRGADVLDVGCGSGILGLVALKLGARRVRAIDVDPDAIEVTKENAARNDLVIEADTADVSSLSDSFSIVLANIEAAVLIPMASALSARVAKDGLLVLSGILTQQAQGVIDAYPSLELLEQRAKGEWVAITLRA